MIKISSPKIGFSEYYQVFRTLAKHELTSGNNVLKFENMFSTLLSGPNCVAVNSGTSALHLSLIALGVGKGDEVIVPSLTFAATANVVKLVGATPIFADINLESYCIDPDYLETLITSRTKCIIPVHLYGHPADMIAIKKISLKYNLSIIEDCAQAHFASINNKYVGTWGDIGCFSFYSTKNITTAEGGLVTTFSDHVARLIKLLRNQGMETKYSNEIFGYNNRLSDIHAAIGIAQLNRSKKQTLKRIENATFFTKNLPNVITPKIQAGFVHVFHQYVILVPGKRADFLDYMAKNGVQCAIYYPTLVHNLPSFSLPINLPNSSHVSESCVAIPVHPQLSKSDRNKIVDLINEYYK
jgi:dTDP-4-amino-4,6-dideoxygalactose transaminase